MRDHWYHVKLADGRRFQQLAGSEAQARRLAVKDGFEVVECVRADELLRRVSAEDLPDVNRKR